MALTRVYGTIIGDDNTPVVAATVTATLNAQEPVITSGGLVLSESSTTTTNGTGGWALNVIANDDIVTPKNTTYTFQFTAPAPAPTVQPFYAYASTIKAHGVSFSKTVKVPSASAVDFSTLV